MRAVAATLVLAAISCSDGSEKLSTHSYRGGRPPELNVPPGHWINSPLPVTLSALRGRVVWLEFSFLG